MTEPAARVYDLDGTLVRLAVDWDAVAAEVRTAYRDAGVDVGDDVGLWELLERAPEHGIESTVEETIAAHERAGAERSERLPAADELADLGVPVGVCSLNCEAACRVALETHGLDGYVEEGAIVGRDSTATHKPDPTPLLATVEALAVDPDDVVFVGDSERDAVTAERAGTRFAYVGGR